jgi:deoxyribodipyrimidine photolyase-like uncharacterized protein
VAVLRIILGDQLSLDLSALDDLDARRDIVLMMGVLEENTHVRHHKQKIVLVFADNQLTRTAAVELARRAPDALCNRSASRDSGKARDQSLITIRIAICFS